MRGLTDTFLDVLYKQEEAQIVTGYIRASSIGDCSRRIAYSLQAWDSEPQSPTSAHVTTLGTMIHLWVQMGLVACGLVDAELKIGAGELYWEGNCEVELVDSERKIIGHTDAITNPLVHSGSIYIPSPDGKRAIVEAKSIGNSRREDKITGFLKEGKFDRLTRPYGNHVAQATLYADLASKKLGEDIEDIIILYIAKDFEFGEFTTAPKLPFKVFATKKDPEVVEMLYDKAESIWQHVDAGTLPDREYMCNSSNVSPFCTYCDYHKACYPETFC